MSFYAGLDISTHALDIVLLDEETNAATWTRCELDGKKAWDRTLNVRAAMPPDSFWDDTIIAAIEAPYGRGHIQATSVLNRVVGAVVSALPARLRVPERCWLVTPHEWKGGLMLKGKPTFEDLAQLAGDVVVKPAVLEARGNPAHDAWQNCLDAYCIALFARTENAKGVAA